MRSTPASLTPRERWLSLGAVYACIFANGLGMGLSLPLLSLIMERNGVSATMNGANAMFGAVAMLVVTPFIPALAARIGTVRFLIACYSRRGLLPDWAFARQTISRFGSFCASH